MRENRTESGERLGLKDVICLPVVTAGQDHVQLLLLELGSLLYGLSGHTVPLYPRVIASWISESKVLMPLR